MRHEDYKELLALEAAGTVDPSELRALDSHLAACAECRAERAELRDAAAALAYTVTPVRPPAELRARVLAEVKGLKSALAEETAGAPARPASAVEEARRLSLWQIFGARPALVVGAAAAVLTLAALAALSLALWGRTRQLSAEVARLSSRLGASEEEAARARAELAQVRGAGELLAAPGSRLASLAGTQTAPRSRARVVYDTATGRVLLLAYDLPPVPAGKAYQLWFIAEGRRPLPGGVFKTDAQGRATLSDRLPSVAGLNTFAVTLEDERGVQTPTGAMYLLGTDS